MRTRTCKSRLKPVALLGAAALGLSAFGGIHEWTPAEGGTTYWDDEANWVIGSEDWTDYRIGNNGSEVSFRSAITADDSYEVLFYNGTHTLVADEASFGLSKPNATLKFCAPWWFTGSPILNITSGTYEFGTVNVTSDATYNGSATLNLNGGSLTASYVSVGAGCTLTLNGGTLSALTVTGGGSVSVGANGGTFAYASDAIIDTALTGTGTLTNTGTGALAIEGAITGFTGKIAVAAGAGSVTVAALGVTVAAGEEFQFGVYTWTGAAEDGLWKTPGNWLVNGVVPTALPGDDSTVIFPAGDDVTVVVNGAHTGNMTINRNVTLAAENVSGSVYLYLDRVGGTGTLTLKGASNTRWLRVGNTGDYTIDCDLEIKGHVYVANSSAKTLVVNGAFKGDGTVTCNGNADAGIAFYGDTSAFAGYYEGGLRNNGNRDNTKFRSDARGSALASWKFGGYGNTLASPFESDNVTYQFGALNTYAGTYPRLTLAGLTSTTIEVGEKGQSDVGGTLSNNGNTLRKVGANTTLNVTLTEEYGTVEAKAGTVNIYGTVPPAAAKFAGNSATIRIARSTTTTTIVTPAVVDNPDTEEDETADAVTETTTTDNIASSFVPGFTDALVGCQYVATQETVDNVTYDVYTVLTEVATDSAGTVYDSVALALAAIAADETGTLTKVVTLAKSTTEAVTLPNGYSLALNGNTIGSVVGATGVGVAYDKATDTWTTGDNSEATWTGKAGDGLWETAGNWSTEFVPNEGTKVVFEDTATVFLSGCNNYDCGEFNIAKGKTVTLAPVEYNQANWPRVRVHGNITSSGECTLKLFRCGIDNAKDDGSVVEVRPTVTFENDGEHDSWMTGSFDLKSGFTGTGLFIAYGSDGSGRLKFTTGSITIPAGSVVDFRGGNYPTYGGSGGVISAGGLNGDGRVIIHTIPGNSVDRTYFQNAFKNAERWTGTCELAGVSIGSIDAANYGNANSTVCFNGVSGYLRYSTNSTTEVGKVKTIEIGASGLTLNNYFSSGTFGYIIAADITGSGPIHFGTRHNDAAVGQYFLTGSLEGFTGAIDFGSLDSYRPAVIIKDPKTYAPAVNDYGQIIVAAERTVTVSGAWNAPGGFVVLGNVNVASTGSITSTNGLCGGGTVTYAAIPATAPGCFAGGTSSGTNREIPAWTGTVVLPATEISTKTGLPLPALSTANSTIVVKGITRATNQNSLYLGTGASCTVQGTTQLDGELNITDGNSNATYTWNKITGTGNALLTAEGGSAAGITHAITTLSDYSGTITVGKNVTLTIGTINLASAPSAGDRLVKTAVSGNGVISAANAKVAVNGEEITEPETLLLKSDGIYYGTATSTAYDGGDGSTFSIDSAVAAVMTTYLPAGATLASTVEGKTFTYAQAYALGLVSVENDALVVDDLTATIAVVDGKVIVSLGSTPEAAYTITCNVYENTSLTDTWSETPAHTYVVGSETEAAGFTPESDAAGFYKVGVTIGNKTATSQE